MKNVIVTGASGFIGRTLVNSIRRRFGSGCVVTALSSSEVDLADRAAAFEWFARARSCDHIIHLAALYKAGDWPVRHPATQFDVNLAININLLEAWRRFFPHAKLTSILSYCMYPSHPDPHPETELFGTEPEDYLFAYAFTKKAMLVGQRAYRVEHGMTSTSVILPTVYGPGDSFAENSHVMGALVGKFVRAAHEGLPAVEVWGDGTQKREFLFVEDAADGIVAAALGSKVDVLNLGAGTAYSISYVAERITEAAGFKGSVVHNLNRFTGVKTRLLEVSRAGEILGWTAPTPIEDGIIRTVRWYSDSINEKN